jgi:S-adenosyl-L-methionine hydrolase (adenosine-forming)
MIYITLLSDWKLRDPYVSLFKGDIIQNIPDCQIFDITHAIEFYKMEQGAFISRAGYSHFPKGSIHVLLVGNTFSSKTKPIIMKFDDHWFIGEDNGIFQLILGEDYFTELYQYQDDNDSALQYKLIEMIKWIDSGTISEHTSEIFNLKPVRMNQLFVNQSDKSIKGEIVYIDSQCNAVTNIPNSTFNQMNKGGFLATISSSKHIKITKKHDFYNAAEPEVYLFPNRLGFIEITFFPGKIAILGDLKAKDIIEIKFT